MQMIFETKNTCVNRSNIVTVGHQLGKQIQSVDIVGARDIEQ